MRDLSLYGPTVPARNLTCTQCDTLVQVVELPGPFLDPHAFVCGQCLTRGAAFAAPRYTPARTSSLAEPVRLVAEPVSPFARPEPRHA